VIAPGYPRPEAFMEKVFDEFDDEVEDTDETGKYDIASD
jgi:hypothetical protein